MGRGPGEGRFLLTCMECVQAMRPLLFAALVGLSAGTALGPLPTASGGRLMRVTPRHLQTEPCAPALRTLFYHWECAHCGRFCLRAGCSQACGTEPCHVVAHFQTLELEQVVSGEGR